MPTAPLRVVIPILLLMAFSSAHAQDNTSILAVLEDTPGMTTDAPNYRSVRVTFFKAGREWKAYPTECVTLSCFRSVTPSFSADVAWTVGFDGRILGQVRTRLAERTTDMLFGQFRVTSNSVPSVGKPGLEFAGWLGSPVLRPLILNSHPFVADPELWKPSTLSKDDIAKLRLAFNRKYPMLTNCENMDAKQYKETDISAVKSYRSMRDWRVAQLAMKGCETDGERGDELMAEWFVISPDGKVRYLDSNMHLVDAGDYDHDGKSELVFSIDDYNRGGYKLFYDDFKQKAVFEFSYH